MAQIPVEMAGKSQTNPRFMRRALALPGFWITVVVLIAVGGRLLWVRADRPAHFKEIIAAFDSANRLYAMPRPDHAGNRITYAQTTENGAGVFLCDTVTTQKQLVCEETVNGSGDFEFDAGPWSPDDSLFVYSRLNMVNYPPVQDLVICEASRGQEVARFALGTNEVNTFTCDRFVWLTPTLLAAVNGQDRLHLFQKQTAGGWTESVPTEVKVGAASLTALPDTTIAWRDKNQIWTLDVVSNQRHLLFELKTKTLKEFSYSRETGQLLLNCAEKAGDSFWRLTPGDASPLVPSRIASVWSVNHARWINGSQVGYAYMNGKPDNNTVLVQADSRAKPVTLFAQGDAEGLTGSADGNKLFIVGVATNEPFAGIWEYNVTAETLRCIIPCTDHPSPYAKRSVCLTGSLQLPSGRKVNYRVYPPATFDRHQHKQYPLVIGDTGFFQYGRPYPGLPNWAPAMTSCGAYFVIVLRSSWYGVDQWGEDVTAVYQHLAQSPAIDAQRVFLYGWSVETIPMSELLAKNPAPWRGAMMLSPLQFPDLSVMPPGNVEPKILISNGGAEGSGKRVQDFQEGAIKSGVIVDVVTHPDAVHRLQGNSGLRERTRAMVDFVFGE